MLNVTFYEDTITDSAAPKKTSKCHLETLKNGRYMFHYTTFESFNSDLSSLTNGYYMFHHSDIKSFSGDLSSLTNGSNMFYYCAALTSFSGDLPSLTNGWYMFNRCENLTSFSGDLSNVTDGTYMFAETALQLFNEDLPNLTYGGGMFYKTALESFNIDLSSLTDGGRMFMRSTLQSFNSDLSSLTNGDCMFNSCTVLQSFETNNLAALTHGKWMFYKSALESFSGNLSSLVNGYDMFYMNPLQSFSGDLPSLIFGRYMFSYCKLDALSVMIIVESIRDITSEKASLTASDYVTRTGSGTVADPYVYSKPFGWMSNGSYVYTYNKPQPYTNTIKPSEVGALTIGINVTNNSSTIATQLQEFAEAANYDSWVDLKQAFADKGWTVTWQYGGTNISITLSDDEAFRSVPIWAKIEEVVPEGETYTEKEIANAEYCTEDGSKYYNISWGHDVNDEAKDETMTDESKYFYFGSLLEACGYWGVIPKQYLESNN